MKKSIKKSILETVHESAKSLHDAGLLKAETMRTFDELCLKPVHDLSPHAIKQIRLHARVSQAVFAAYLNTSQSTIKKWETGEKHPKGASLKLLNIVAEKGLEVVK